MPRLPPVPISPQTRLRARLWPGVGNSVFTCAQPQSSSSATSCANPVSVPCPISERAMRTTQMLSGRITTQALTSVPVPVAFLAAAAAAPAPSNASGMPSASPPPATAAEPTMNLRRERLVTFDTSGFFMIDLFSLGFRLARGLGRKMHGSTNALIRAAAADVGHRLVDVGVARARILLEQRCRGHDLPGLAVAALRNVELRPRLLHRMRAGRGQPFDGDDPVACLDRAQRNRARATNLAVDVHRARAALRDAATILGAGQSDLLSDDPQQRRVILRLHVVDLAVDVELCHETFLLRFTRGQTRVRKIILLCIAECGALLRNADSASLA